MKTSEKGRAFIKNYEALRLKAYQDQGGVWTIGYGTTVYKGGEKVKAGDIFYTEEQAESFFDFDLEKFEKAVHARTQDLNLSQNQFDALVCFAYNVGIPAFSRSTLLKKVRACKDCFDSLHREFIRWQFVKGKKSIGLLRRRNSEFKIYKDSDYERK